jgi:hypothetical protein
VTKQEALLFLELANIADFEGKLSDAAFELGERLRDEFAPGQYTHIYEHVRSFKQKKESNTACPTQQ